MGLFINGRKGEIKVGYRTIGTITRYRYESNPQGEAPGWTVEGDVADVDRFYADRADGKFDLILNLGEGRARWRGVAVMIGPTTFNASGQGLPETI